MKKYYSLSTGLFKDLVTQDDDYVLVLEDDKRLYAIHRSGKENPVYLTMNEFEEWVEDGSYIEIDNPFDK